MVGNIIRFSPALDQTNEGFDQAAFESLFSREQGSFWFRSRNVLIKWAISNYFDNAKLYLEIGCGTGFVLSMIRSSFQEMQCSGSEVHVKGLKFARRRVGEISLYQMDARRIPFIDEYDLIGAFDVLEHIDEDERVLSQMFDALRPGGGILLTVPQHPSLWSAVDEQAKHVRRYTRSELESKVAKAGFEVLRTTSFVTTLLPFMAISRFRNRSKGQSQDTEFELSRTLNALFEKALGLEIAMIRRGVSLPAGGSLLLAARRRD